MNRQFVIGCAIQILVIAGIIIVFFLLAGGLI